MSNVTHNQQTETKDEKEMNNVQFQLQSQEGDTAVYLFQTMNHDHKQVEGMFEVNLPAYCKLSEEGVEDAEQQAIYWLTPIQSDEQYWSGMKVFFRVYKHYLEHRAYIGSSE
ncbi:hypothetical protein [Paenibacillus arenosi]|uniref:Uncharacterized protein n=1 Tax=Paenibacillus arenosi TaxID=2774142 RepID=A0ABR9AT82_9BACL|nr:hypothetical protein [Paenibacillus arenosi]MBD8496913.1 hypothetical protein [Paenibacillus arenosi]